MATLLFCLAFAGLCAWFFFRQTMIRTALCGVAVALIIAGCSSGSGSGGGSSSSGGADTNSDSYKQGFNTGQGDSLYTLTSGDASQVDQNCDVMFTQQSAVFKYDQTQFMQGCEDGYKQAHP